MRACARWASTATTTPTPGRPRRRRIEKDGSFYLYGNDIERGFDVYRFDGDAKTSKRDGRWMTPAQARRQELKLPDVKLPVDVPMAGIAASRKGNTLFCLVASTR